MLHLFRGLNLWVFLLLVATGLGITPMDAAFAAPAAPASPQTTATYGPEPYDPLESTNRNINKFNNVIDTYLLKPIVHVYQALLPKWGRERVTSFLSNLTEPVTIVNSVLQGNSTNAFNAFWRFTLNSTVGIGGAFDIAQQAGLEARREDFGQTLGAYGAGSGPYLILPLLGPSSGRDAVGKIVDVFTNPFLYLLDDDALLVIKTTDIINGRSETLAFTDKIEKTSLDPYATVRSLYLQSRYDEIHNGARPSNRP